MEPEGDEQPTAGTDKAIPAETVERLDALGRELGLVWVGVFVVAAVLIAIIAWIVA